LLNNKICKQDMTIKTYTPSGARACVCVCVCACVRIFLHIYILFYNI